MPAAQTSISTENRITPPFAGCAPPNPIFPPTSTSTRSPAPIRNATSTATLIGHGRSPLPYGSSVARTAAFFCSERLTRAVLCCLAAGCAATADWVPVCLAAGCAATAGGRDSGGLERRPRLRLRCANCFPVAVERFSQMSRDLLGVRGFYQRTDHRDAPRAGGHDGADCALVNPTDGKERNRRPLRRISDHVESDRRSPGLGRRLVYRSDPDVVGSIFRPRGINLGLAVSGESHQPLRTDQCARLSDRDVVLAHVYPVGLTLDDQVRAVVEDEQGPMRRAHARKPTAGGDDLPVSCALEAKLHDVDSTAHRRLQETVVLLAADEVQTGRLQAAAPIVPGPMLVRAQMLHAPQSGTVTALASKA